MRIRDTASRSTEDDVPRRVHAVLARFRPHLDIDACDVLLVSVVDGVVTLRVVGAMRCCPMSQAALAAGLDAAIRTEVAEVRAVVFVPEP